MLFPSRRVPLLIGIATLAVLAGVYGIGRLTGNAEADPACQASVETTRRMAPLVRGEVAAVSVGIYRGVPVLDLDYAEDSNAETDMNVVMNSGGAFVEVQGTAEGHAFRRHELDQLLDLATKVIAQLHAAQQSARAA